LCRPKDVLYYQGMGRGKRREANRERQMPLADSVSSSRFVPAGLVQSCEITIQVNGKVCTRFKLRTGIETSKLVELALADPKVQTALAGRSVARAVSVPDKLVNLVVKD
jgi:leucyl-tRNA synthetase